MASIALSFRVARWRILLVRAFIAVLCAALGAGLVAPERLSAWTTWIPGFVERGISVSPPLFGWRAQVRRSVRRWLWRRFPLVMLRKHSRRS